MKILLVGNYPLDKQASMRLFAETLLEGLSSSGHNVKLLLPGVVLGRWTGPSKFLTKWLGYIDKFIIFPFRLIKEARSADIAHICDHSNAIYVQYLRKKPHLVTCHDVLAIRGGLGEDTDCPASLTGKFLQRWILKGLEKARAIVCDSTYTKKDLLRLLGRKDSAGVYIILPGLCQKLKKIAKDEQRNRLGGLFPDHLERKYLLHVGSALKRKNRKGVLEVFIKIKDQWNGYLVFAGAPLDGVMTSLIAQYDISSRVIQVAGFSASTLEALYNGAFALVYLSRFEGSGLPIIEAQACGCPVLCSSDCGPFPEIAGDSAVLRPSKDIDGFAEAILRLEGLSERESLIKKGFQNVEKFSAQRMVNDYARLYREILEEK